MSRTSPLRRNLISIVACTMVLTVGLIFAPAAGPPGVAASAQAAVRTCSSTTPVAYRPTLWMGDTGSCVRVLQQSLIAKGYTVGVWGADGAFGNATYLAVRRFQADYIGVTIDGIVGRQTWQTLVYGGARYSRSTGPNRSSRVVLSYDDCPTSLAAFQSAVLGAQRLGIALVLFPTGACITSGRFSPSYARSHGHYVFNHTITHPNLTTLTYAGVLYQLGPPGVVTTFGRPPGGNYNTLTVLNAYAAKAMRIWTWSVDTRDWTGKSQSAVVWYAVTYARAGSTVLMHMGWHAFNSGAIAQIKAGLNARGLGVCRNLGPTTVSPLTVPC